MQKSHIMTNTDLRRHLFDQEQVRSPSPDLKTAV